jgi:hypothetical protein
MKRDDVISAVAEEVTDGSQHTIGATDVWKLPLAQP